MNRNLPLLLALGGGALVFFLWQQQQAQAAARAQAIKDLPPLRELVPQEWIEMTPEGYTVPGTTDDPFDILT